MIWTIEDVRKAIKAQEGDEDEPIGWVTTLRDTAKLYLELIEEHDSLRAELTELRNENEELKRNFGLAYNEAGQLRKDKERLDWLDGPHRPEDFLCLCGEKDIRQAIDNAIKEGGDV